MRSRPFALLGTTLLETVQRVVEQSLSAWRSDWGLPDNEVMAATMRADDAQSQLPQPPRWHAHWGGGTAKLWVSDSEQIQAQLHRLLFGTEVAQPLGNGRAYSALATVEAAWIDLVRRLAGVLVPGAIEQDAVAAPDAESMRTGSGGIVVLLRIGRRSSGFLLSHDAVQMLAAQCRLRAATPPPSLGALRRLTLGELLTQQSVRLTVALGQAEVDLGQLARLQVGDVIRLGQSAEQALHVYGPLSTPLFNGYLGRSGGCMALELAPRNINFGVKHEQ